MKNKKKIISSLITVIVLLGILGGAFCFYKFYYVPNNQLRSIEVFDSNKKKIESIEVKNGSLIQILDSTSEPIEEIKIDKDTESIQIEFEAKDTAEKLFMFYKIENNEETSERKKDYLVVPVYQSKLDFVLTLTADQNSSIKQEDQLVREVRIPIKKDETFKDILPEVQLRTHFKGNWVDTETKENIQPEAIISKDMELKFISYQDKNDNGIDDLTEKFTVKFETNIEEKVPAVEVGWEETIKLPVLSHEEKVFFEWYTDSKMHTIFTESTEITQNMTLYAKVKNIKDVMNESVEEPITRKDLALQVERILNLKNKEVDKKYNESIQEENKKREDKKEQDKKNNEFNTDITYSTEFANTALNKLYFVSFVDESNQFIYGFVSPYGRTIKIVNSDNRLWKEYSIRQHTTIKLDSNVLVGMNEDLVDYKSEYYKVNDTLFVKITPKVLIMETFEDQEN